MDKKLASNALWIMFHGLTDLLPSSFQIGGPINKFVTPWVQKTTIGLIFDDANSIF
jgi:hypothetical protein